MSATSGKAQTRFPYWEKQPGLECHVVYREDHQRELIIDRAEPQIRITSEALIGIAEGNMPFACLLADADPGPDDWWPAEWCKIPGFKFGPIGCLLRIEACNRTVIYRIMEYLGLPDAFRGEWPD